MTSKERMMTAVRRGKPDRLPITIHQWQAYHLETFMRGMDQLEAFIATDLDASITPFDLGLPAHDGTWHVTSQDLGLAEGQRRHRHTIQTPDGSLTWTTAANEYTTFTVEPILKSERDVELFLKYWPTGGLDQQRLSRWYDRTGDRGILRGFVAFFAQPGPWQDFCEMAGTQRAILWAMDDPAFVHHFLAEITKKKVAYVHEHMAGARYDLIEHGGGAASSTVISPTMFDEFCVPYDKQIIAALHEHGFPVVYHTCGGMMAILDHIPANGCDASETLSPTGVGGDIRPASRRTVKKILGSKVGLIGGLDQGELLTKGTPQQVRAEVHDLFETFGAGGGYICSASDHFFHTPVENLQAMARAAMECTY